MNISERYLVAMLIVFTVPYLIWRFGRTDRWAPLVVVQIVAGILLGPGVMGSAAPETYQAIFKPEVVQMLNGVAWWAVMLFVFIAGIELDLRQAWAHRRESGLTAGLALGTPMLAGCAAAVVLLATSGSWIGPKAEPGQFVAAVGMACAVSALPILILFLEKLDLLHRPMGQRVLRYASLDDIAIWGVLALILAEWARLGWQLLFLGCFAACTLAVRRWMPRLAEADRWAAAFVWLLLCGLGSDLCGLHFMVGAFLAGAVMDAHWFNRERLDALRHQVLHLLMPVFFLSTGLRTRWEMGDMAVVAAAGLLLAASVGGKLLGVRIAGRLLGWSAEESRLIGWLLQTKALIMIVFANVLLDKQIITGETFTALLLMAVGSTMLTIPMVSRRGENLGALPVLAGQAVRR